MKKSFLLLSAGIIALLFACSGDVAEHENFQPPIQTEAKLTVVVVDWITRSLVPNAEVTLLSTDIKGTTNSEGTVIFKNIHVGNHRLLIKKEGYADAYETADIAGLSDENIHIAEDNVVPVILYPKNAGLLGYVHYMNKNGQQVPAEGVKVYIEFGSDYNEKRDSATTDKDGKYEFSKLPPEVYYTIWAEGKVLDGIAFERLDIGYSELISNGKVYNDVAVLKKSNSLFEVDYYKNILEKNEALVFTFTDSVNVELLVTKKMIKLKYVPSMEDILVNISWSDDYKKLTIAPPMGGKWKGNFEVKFDSLKSTNGRELVYSYEPEHCKACYYDYREEGQWGYVDKNYCDYVDGYWSYDSYFGTNVCKITNCDDVSYYDETTCRSYDSQWGGKWESYTWIGTKTSAYYPITVKQIDLSTEKIKVDAVWSDSIRHTSQYINLRWNKVEDADESGNYRIFRKIGSKGGYENITNSVEIKKGTKMYADNVPLKPSSVPIDGDTVSFIVQVFNETSQSFLDTAVAYRADIRDIAPPTLMGSLPVWGNSTSNLRSNLTGSWVGDPRLVGDYYLNFTEPMDTTEIRVEWTRGRLLVEPKWTSDTQLHLKLSVKAGTAITNNVSETYSIAGLKDRAGNNLVGLVGSGIVDGTANINISVDK
jgi:hypothetical protein